MTQANQPDVVVEFAKLATRHDVTYEYSDDHSAWVAGRDEYARIRAIYNAADQRTKLLLCDVWNEIMRMRFKPEHVAEWLWPEPKGGA